MSVIMRELGRDIPYYPRLGKALGGAGEAIFLQYLIYCPPDHPGGWICKTQVEIEKETGLTHERQMTIRKKLRTLGILEERYERLAHRKYYRVSDEEFRRFWGEFLKKEEG